MKNLFLSVLFVLTASFAFASNPDGNIKVEIEKISEIETIVINIDFDSFEYFDIFDADQLNVFDDECTATITVTVSFGYGSTYISVTITLNDVPCSEIGAAVKNAVAQAKEAIQQ